MNKSVYDDAKISEVFATLSVVVINKERKTVRYAGAGDLPILYKNSENGTVEKMISGGSLLGFSARGDFEDLEIKLHHDDFILMLTDGIIDSRNEKGEPLGSDKVIDILRTVQTDEDPLNEIVKELNNFTGGSYEDDISLISIKAD